MDPALLLLDGGMEDLVRARERFLAGDPAPAGVRPVVLASWQRSRDAGIDPLHLRLQAVDSAALSSARDAAAHLLAAAEPFLRLAHETLASEPHLIALADRDGIILRMLTGPGLPAAEMGRANLFEGASWDERDIGCNGVGTSLATEAPVILIGPEHFQESYVGWTCIGVPIRSGGEIVGALDLSVPNQDIRIQTWGWVLSIAQGIEVGLSTGDPEKALEGRETPLELAAPFHGVRGVLELLGRQLDLPPTHAGFLREALAKLVESEGMVNAAVSRLQATQEGLRRISDSGMVGVLWWEMEGRISYANDRFLEMMGYSREELRKGQLDWRALTPPGWEAVDAAAIEELLSTGASRPFEKEYFRKDGSRIPILLSAATFSDRRDRGITLVIDISERKRAEERQRLLAEASALFDASLDVEATLRSLAGLMVSSFADFCVVDVSEGEKGIRRMEVAHRDPAHAELARRLREDAGGAKRGHAVSEAMRDGEPLLIDEIDDELIRVGGQSEEHLSLAEALGPRSAIVVPLMARSRTLGALTLVAAKSRRRYTPDDLASAVAVASRAALAVDNAQLYEQARRAIVERERVLAVVSHDLRNPLNTITMASSLLLDEIPAERKQGQVAIITRAAEQMRRLVEDLLDFARIEVGAFYVAVEPNHAVDLLQAAAEFLIPLAESRSVRLTLGGTTERRVRSDRARVLQVFTNLISNAVAHTPPGGSIVLSAEEQGEEVLFTVEDTGAGILPEHLEHVFDPFWSADRGATGGVGLGLGIARGIVESHGGRIWMESTPGRGSRACFSLPVWMEG